MHAAGTGANGKHYLKPDIVEHPGVFRVSDVHIRIRYISGYNAYYVECFSLEVACSRPSRLLTSVSRISVNLVVLTE